MAARLDFPKGFLWGTSQGAHQVEGGCGRSDWWVWEQTPGHVAGGDSSRDAAQWWERADDDFVAASRLGLGALRFSVEWSRVEPAEGRFDEAALARYAAWAERLRALGLEPVVCLLHQTLPQWLAARGGLERPEAVERFGRFADRVVDALGDRVRWWLTVDDPAGLVARGWLLGSAPPGKKQDLAGALRAARHLVRAHATAYRLIHRRLPGALVSAGVQVTPPAAGAASLLDRSAAWLRDWLSNRVWLESTLDGRLRPPLGAFERIAEAAGTHDVIALQADGDALAEAALGLARHGRPILVAAHRPAGDGLAALVRPLAALHRAIQAGADVRGYLYASLVDAFDFAEGYRRPAGLLRLDRATQARTVTERAVAFGDLARRNALVLP
ncbi:MAG TPA: family 1 glycosylhydrolase [Anaeromyxobacteraceae bacterium]|nr:family 1 glycosylhydrolase [Anaeromyxobacteraceae bacterium]